MYDKEFFDRLRAGARRSADAVVPLLVDMFAPRSVVDVGCGTGGWLASFARHGVPDITGIDGAYVVPEMLEIPPENFRVADLRQPLSNDRQFDLAISLEVAEHLPQRAAASFVASLTRLSSAVVFSAAIPGQLGDGHINEQWPEYWTRLFSAHGYVCADPWRDLLWDRDDVEWWYAQNILLYVSKRVLSTNRPLAEKLRLIERPRPLVHPRRYQETLELFGKTLGPLTIRALHPPRTMVSQPFNEQPSHVSALAIACENAWCDIRVLWDGEPLHASFAAPDLVSALVPRELYSEAGHHDIVIESLQRRSEAHPFVVQAT